MSKHCCCCSTNRQWFEEHFDPNAEFQRGYRRGEFTVESEMKVYSENTKLNNDELQTIRDVLLEIAEECECTGKKGE